MVLLAILITASAACGGDGSPSSAAPQDGPMTSQDGATPTELTDISGWYRVPSYFAGPCGLTKALT